MRRSWLIGTAFRPRHCSLPSERLQNYIAFRNGLFDVDTGKLLPHTPNWFSTSCLPYDYDPKADCPVWKGVVGRILENDPQRIAVLQEWFGNNLVFDTTHQRFLVLSGEGDNGKSVICLVLQEMLGRENVSNLSLESLHARFYPISTLGKLANVSTEIGELDKTAEGTLKAYVSGEPMAMEQKGKPVFMAIPTARLTFATNNVPGSRISRRGCGNG
jgi:putative DNA primase/helicase